MIRRMEHLSNEESLRKMGLLSLEKGRLQYDLSEVFQYLKEDYKRETFYEGM